jgi:hypothetical protein
MTVSLSQIVPRSAKAPICQSSAFLPSPLRPWLPEPSAPSKAVKPAPGTKKIESRNDGVAHDPQSSKLCRIYKRLRINAKRRAANHVIDKKHYWVDEPD